MENPSTNAVPNDTRTLPLQDRISAQAYQLWDGYGRPEGRDVAIWLEAERQVLGVDRQVNQQAGGAVAAPALSKAVNPRGAATPDGQDSPGRHPAAPSARPSPQQPDRPPVGSMATNAR